MGKFCLIREALASDTDDDVSGSWMVPMVGVIVLALGLQGCSTPIHEGNTIGRAVTVAGMW
jgi:hypothetical protein